MKLALEMAIQAKEQGEVPVGAIIVHKGRVIAAEHNRVESLQDPTAHAELLALRSACRVLGNWRLLDVVLYTTLEPCSMCLGAIINSRCPKVIWGAPDLRQGADGSWCKLLHTPHPISNPQLQGGCLAQESACILREFFKSRRTEH